MCQGFKWFAKGCEGFLGELLKQTGAQNNLGCWIHGCTRRDDCVTELQTGSCDKWKSQSN